MGPLSIVSCAVHRRLGPARLERVIDLGAPRRRLPRPPWRATFSSRHTAGEQRESERDEQNTRGERTGTIDARRVDAENARSRNARFPSVSMAGVAPAPARAGAFGSARLRCVIRSRGKGSS